MRMPTRDRPPLWQWLAAAIACTVGVVIAVMIAKIADPNRRRTANPSDEIVNERLENLGTIARITFSSTKNNRSSGGVQNDQASSTIEKRLPRMDFSIVPGQSIDPRIPAGEPIEIAFTVTFITGPVRKAYIGVEVQGGSAIVMRGGRVILSTYAASEPVTRFSTDPEAFGSRQQQITITFRPDPKSRSHLRALWRPDEAEEPSPLPSESVVAGD